jgi:hypothetical protein
MLVSFDTRFSDTPDLEALNVEILVDDTIPFVLSLPSSALAILCMHRSLPGEHVQSPECWCEPEQLLFGVQPYFAEA